MAQDVFISYSTIDKVVADKVCETLESAGMPCWIAPRDIAPGMEWSESIVDAIAGSKLMLLLFSSAANNSPQVRREVERAVSKGTTILPLRIENVEPAKHLEYFIGTVHWMDAWTAPLESHLPALVETVRRMLARSTTRDQVSQKNIQIGKLDNSLAGAGLERVILRAGQVLFRQGEAGESMYILEEGKIDICVEISKDEERTLCTVEPTVILGEMSMLLNRPRTATAIANTDVRLWKVAHAKFQEGIQNRDGWAVKLLAGTSQVLARRVAAMNEELVAQINDLRRLQAEPKPCASTGELEELSERLFTQWSF